MLELTREEASQREAAAEVAADEQRQMLSADVEELLHASFDARRRFSDMQETLDNHKREVRNTIMRTLISVRVSDTGESSRYRVYMWKGDSLTDTCGNSSHLYVVLSTSPPLFHELLGGFEGVTFYAG